MSVAHQLGLLDRGAVPAVDATALDRISRTELEGGAWIDYLPGWVAGQEALFEALAGATRWRSERMPMYDRVVDVPRLIASLPEDGPGHPLLTRIRDLLTARYGVPFPNVTLGHYRTGADSVAWHGDRVARNMADALVATVSLGGPRRFLLRRRSVEGQTSGRSQALMLGLGDLLVMGGSCQRTWQHTIPKAVHAEPRIAVMFRPDWYRG